MPEFLSWLFMHAGIVIVAGSTMCGVVAAAYALASIGSHVTCRCADHFGLWQSFATYLKWRRRNITAEQRIEELTRARELHDEHVAQHMHAYALLVNELHEIAADESVPESRRAGIRRLLAACP